jgi:hypothetical protein
VIYISILSENLKEANKFMRETFHEEGDTFVVNQKDQDGNEYCLISIPNNDSPYNQAIIKQFGSHESKDPRKVEVTKPSAQTLVSGKLTAGKIETKKITMSDIDGKN